MNMVPNDIKKLMEDLIDHNFKNNQNINIIVDVESKLFEAMDPNKIKYNTDPYKLLYNLEEVLNIDDIMNVYPKILKEKFLTIFKDDSIDKALDLYFVDRHYASSSDIPSQVLTGNHKGIIGILNSIKNLWNLKQINTKHIDNYYDTWFNKMYETFPVFKESYNNLTNEIRTIKKNERLEEMVSTGCTYQSLDDIEVSDEVSDEVIDINSIEEFER